MDEAVEFVWQASQGENEGIHLVDYPFSPRVIRTMI